MSLELGKQEGQGNHPCCQVQLQILALGAAIYNNTYTNKYQWIGHSGNGLKNLPIQVQPVKQVAKKTVIHVSQVLPSKIVK